MPATRFGSLPGRLTTLSCISALLLLTGCGDGSKNNSLSVKPLSTGSSSSSSGSGSASSSSSSSSGGVNPNGVNVSVDMASSTLSLGGSTAITLTFEDADGSAMAVPGNWTATSPCLDSNASTLNGPVVMSQSVSFNYSVVSCTGQDHIQFTGTDGTDTYGASGAVGTAAVQLAKAFGANVTGVCSTRNVPLVKSLGADEVVDYTRQDFRKSATRYDIIFDTVGRTSMRDVSVLLTHRGRYLVTVFGFRDWLRMLWTSLWNGQRMIGGASNFYWKPEDLELLCSLIADGRWKSVIDRTYPWRDVARAHRYVEQGHKRGNVVLIVEQTGAEEQATPLLSDSLNEPASTNVP